MSSLEEVGSEWFFVREWNELLIYIERGNNYIQFCVTIDTAFV